MILYHRYRQITIYIYIYVLYRQETLRSSCDSCFCWSLDRKRKVSLTILQCAFKCISKKERLGLVLLDHDDIELTSCLWRKIKMASKLAADWTRSVSVTDMLFRNLNSNFSSCPTGIYRMITSDRDRCQARRRTLLSSMKMQPRNVLNVFTYSTFHETCVTQRTALSSLWSSWYRVYITSSSIMSQLGNHSAISVPSQVKIASVLRQSSWNFGRRKVEDDDVGDKKFKRNLVFSP